MVTPGPSDSSSAPFDLPGGPPDGVVVEHGGPVPPRAEEVLTPSALALVALLHRRHGARRSELLAQREDLRRAASGAGTLAPSPETASVRDGDWQLPPAPADLADRRVEITGPAEPRMAYNALTSGALVWMADLEDSSTPHWRNVVGAQAVLRDVVRRTLSGTTGDGTAWSLPTQGRLATLVVRPRGWHMDEAHVLVDGEVVAGALVDAALFLDGNAAELIARGSGPYLYLPKLEHASEAALWHDVLADAEAHLGLPEGTVRVTVLIETITAAFEMEEVLHALAPYATGLNAGRWDYLFSTIKTFRDAGAAFVLPDRSALTMTTPFMRAYARALVRTCHRRGAHAIGGMAAAVPSRKDAEAAARALAAVAADKEREAGNGFDGSWVAHPDLVATGRAAFDAVLGEAPNQLAAHADERPAVSADLLLDLPPAAGRVTGAGLATNVSVGVRYLAAWLGGRGAVAIDGLMEDAATAEISRSQVWQWVRAGATTEDGEPVTAERVRALLTEVVDGLVAAAGDDAAAAARAREAGELFERVALADDFPPFLTTAVDVGP
ncbi:malate synthase [Quadrisphaera granulorum]|uniref:Malate synthase n=1 Tax=Quadrisphaera granulorum TaxID=317664 RepID=A0A316A2I5_9ACTN|nr:malate synthase A [Quadrisphaera granulorum]PWJ51762.1 malate synthase [Quadrisphaera granulorum]SZE97709.1 malate synthase [Quadrisphaera granulorum]